MLVPTGYFLDLPFLQYCYIIQSVQEIAYRLLLDAQGMVKTAFV